MIVTGCAGTAAGVTDPPVTYFCLFSCPRLFFFSVSYEITVNLRCLLRSYTHIYISLFYKGALGRIFSLAGFFFFPFSPHIFIQKEAAAQRLKNLHAV